MAATIINRLKKTGQEISVTDRLGVKHTGRVSWFDDDFFSVIDENGDESVFSHIGIAFVSIPGGLAKRALYRSDQVTEEIDEDEV
jgi:hypothetical protein